MDRHVSRRNISHRIAWHGIAWHWYLLYCVVNVSLHLIFCRPAPIPTPLPLYVTFFPGVSRLVIHSLASAIPSPSPGSLPFPSLSSPSPSSIALTPVSSSQSLTATHPLPPHTPIGLGLTLLPYIHLCTPSFNLPRFLPLSPAARFSLHLLFLHAASIWRP